MRAAGSIGNAMRADAYTRNWSVRRLRGARSSKQGQVTLAECWYTKRNGGKHMVSTPVFYEIDRLRHRWGWLLTLGIMMLVLGSIALFLVPAATIGTVWALGSLM